MSHYLYAVLLLLLMIVSIVNAGQKVCPGYGFVRPPKNCKSTCSPLKDKCPLGKKCCFRLAQPCGFHCIIPKDNQPKRGKCPTSKAKPKYRDWYVCDRHLCDVDNDCKGTWKCCRNPCNAAICIPPQAAKRPFV
ncbi:unnamed protein product [Rotaria sp. Silwood1]|nr:unnamed protein product [Rotaria sp. Silwood1]CAF3332541.1 unnamed protein product [Rotaria sp. Silwood1]CAF3343741.1 unnamed protein product [Rotaria sp. Silwood1]CAF4910614.1 unnamed protein product [Rotaria sp. Silwood1]CAF4924005.1 unnamed protein product [Rotaria sp. Silwood1]